MLTLVPLMLASVPPIATVNRLPDFGDYPTAVYKGPLRFPNERDWPDAHWAENAALKVNFAGHFTHIIISCGIACTSDWIIDRRNARMFRTPTGAGDVEPLKIETRADSNLMKIVWVGSRNDGSGDTFPPCFRQFFIWTGSGFRAYAKRTEIQCPPDVARPQ